MSGYIGSKASVTLVDGYTQAEADAEFVAKGLPKAFGYTAVSGATQFLDVGSHNFFDGGTLTADTTVSFTNVPTEARWTYTSNVSGVPYDLSSAYYDDVFLYLGSLQSISPEAMYFHPEGTYVYLSDSQLDHVLQIRLFQPYDLTTAAYTRIFSVNDQEPSPAGLSFSSDGTKMFITGYSTNSVWQYSLSTAWNISTASVIGSGFSVASQAPAIMGITFKPDGTKMYVTSFNGPVYQYSLSTAWDTSTASYDNVNYSSAASTQLVEAQFSADGTKLYTASLTSKNIAQHVLSSAWDLSTASYDNNTFYVGDQESSGLRALALKPDGSKMYTAGGTADTIFQYTLGSAYSVTLPATVRNAPTLPLNIGSQVSYTFFTADGGTTVKLINEEVL